MTLEPLPEGDCPFMAAHAVTVQLRGTIGAALAPQLEEQARNRMGCVFSPETVREAAFGGPCGDTTALELVRLAPIGEHLADDLKAAAVDGDALVVSAWAVAVLARAARLMHPPPTMLGEDGTTYALALPADDFEAFNRGEPFEGSGTIRRMMHGTGAA